MKAHRPRFAIDASSLSGVKGGASFYILNLTEALVKRHRENDWLVYCTRRNQGTLKHLAATANLRAIVPGNRLLRLVFEQLILPLDCRYRKVAVLFSPNYTAPFFHPGFRSLVTFHDLSFFPMWRLYPRSRRIFRTIIRLASQSADSVIAVSDFTRKDILRYTLCEESRIRVIYNAVHARFRRPIIADEIEAARRKLDLNRPYILFTGFLEPRKNLSRLVEAFSQMIARRGESHLLLIVGGDAWWSSAIFERIRRLGLDSHIRFSGYVADEELPPLYAGAEFFAFPSLYEGFGIAALEAISCGTPVLAANNSALPEVVGEAGILVDPNSVLSICEGMLRMLEEPGLLQKLKEACPRIARRFSWELCADETHAWLRQTWKEGTLSSQSQMGR